MTQLLTLHHMNKHLEPHQNEHETDNIQSAKSKCETNICIKTTTENEHSVQWKKNVKPVSNY